MQFLVTMTTQVPDGTSGETVDAIRTREAARSRELVAQGHLLRLWRPPLQPGEWRTFGLFAAADDDELAKVLTSMPLRVWRTDEVVPLGAHPNDPSTEHATTTASPEFFTTFTVSIPGEADPAFEEAKAGEARRAAELAEEGHLRRLWTLPGEGRALGLFRASDGSELAAILEALPLTPWMTVDVVPLSPHPSDPAA